MRPIKFEGFNAILGAPPGWDVDEDGVCEGLPVCRKNGHVYSCWKPSLTERIALIFGKPITLIIANAVTQPPVHIQVGILTKVKS